MIQLSTLLPAIPTGPVRPALLASSGTSGFALALGAVAAPRVTLPAVDADAPAAAPASPPAAPTAAPVDEALLPTLQVAAAPGKDLPEPAVPSEHESSSPDREDEAPESAYAWLAPPIAPEPSPAPAPAVAAQPVVRAEAAPAEPGAPLLDTASLPTEAVEAPVSGPTPQAPEARTPAPSPAVPTEAAAALEMAPPAAPRVASPATHSANAAPPPQAAALAPAAPRATAEPHPQAAAPAPARSPVAAAPLPHDLVPAPAMAPAAAAPLPQAAAPTPTVSPAPAAPLAQAAAPAPVAASASDPLPQPVGSAPTPPPAPAAAAPELPSPPVLRREAVSPPAAQPGVAPATPEPSAPETPGPARADRAAARFVQAPVYRPAPTEQPLQPAPVPQWAAAMLAAAPQSQPSQRRAPMAEPAALGAVAATPLDTLRPHAVAAAADVRQGAIDMRRQEWMGQMVERIEALRDASPLRETRISLAPEALGRVDVSIRQEGERIHVHFAAETPAARQLLTEAQPRLAELAEARGLKLGQSQVDAGGGQGSQRERQQSVPSQQHNRNRHSDASVQTKTSTNGRIA